MAQHSLASLQAAFKKNDNEGGSRPNNYYPFWDMKIGDQAIVRFLPDKNPDNALGFMVEKLMHNLIINGEKKNVPCLKMYGEECPICKVSSGYYKAEDKANGKKYWRKKQHLAQALIVEDPLAPDAETGENHEGKVRFLALGYQLFNVIKETFESGELEEVPFAFEEGCNFIIKKTQQGDYSTYAVGSKFARKTSDLTSDEIAQVKEEMIDLQTLIPAHPGLEKAEAMLEAALTGAEYNDRSDSSGSKNDTPDESDDRSTRTSSKPSSKPSSTETAENGEYDDEADQILASIRNRQAKKAD